VRRIWFVLIALLSVPAYCPAAGGAVIHVGSEVSFAPYAMQDEGGVPIGYSIDLIKAVARAEGLQLEFSAGPWDMMWERLVTGKLDVLPIVARLPERENLVDFSAPHTEAFDAFFVRSGEPSIGSIDAARGKAIVVMRADAAHHALLGRKFEGRIVLADTIPQGLFLVAAGNYDAFLGSLPVCATALRQDGIGGLEAGPPIPDYKRVFHFGIKKGEARLAAALDRGLQTIKASGEYDAIYRRWLTGKKASTPLPWPAIGLTVLALLVAIGWFRRAKPAP
jgi:ABC-type amino acid transport substrate-binding protein